LVQAGSEGLIFLPHLTGERAPVWDTRSTGVFFGIRLHHTDAHFARAVLEGVCFGLCQVLEAVETGSGNISRIHVSGGFITSELWLRMLADITGKQIVLVQAEDASAIGAAMIGMKSLSLINNYTDLFKEKKLATIEPDLEQRKKYQPGFRVYKQLYYALKDSMHLHHQDNH
jgi:gluconokinase